MTCEEFMDAAGGLTPSQLLRMRSAEDQPLVAHVGECGACREWLESHRVLGNALHALSASTAPLEASPKVEQMLLQAFRKQEFAPRAVELTQKAAKSLWTLSRFFEAGAYAAVAAALVVGVFLGARILRDQQNKTNRAPLQAVNAPQSNKAAAAAQNSEARTTAQAPQVATKAATSIASSAVAARKQSAQAAASQANSAENGGFVALMLCDPLICSGDEQVIRMELPASAVTGVDSSTTQTVLADVVIGDDGLIRRMRIVN
jgi:hypothetical protein